MIILEEIRNYIQKDDLFGNNEYCQDDQEQILKMFNPPKKHMLMMKQICDTLDKFCLEFNVS